MEHGLLLAAILFVLGLIGVLTRRNLVIYRIDVPGNHAERHRSGVHCWRLQDGAKWMVRSCSS